VENHQARNACTATAAGAQPLEVSVPAPCRRMLMELLTTLKLCEDRGSCQLTFFEERYPQPEQQLLITETCT
jgi:hypothetical protein